MSSNQVTSMPPYIYNIISPRAPRFTNIKAENMAADKPKHKSKPQSNTPLKRCPKWNPINYEDKIRAYMAERAGTSRGSQSKSPPQSR
jgi:hypothetical protein